MGLPNFSVQPANRGIYVLSVLIFLLMMLYGDEWFSKEVGTEFLT